MKATEFCKFFEFSLERKHGYDEDEDEYNYVAMDDQGTLDPRYVMDVDDLTECFDSLLKDYIDDGIQEHGFEYNLMSDTSYYEQALKWIKTEANELIKKCYQEVVEALVTGKLEDDTEVDI